MNFFEEWLLKKATKHGWEKIRKIIESNTYLDIKNATNRDKSRYEYMKEIQSELDGQILKRDPTTIVSNKWAYLSDTGVAVYEKTLSGHALYKGGKVYGETNNIIANALYDNYKKDYVFIIFGGGNLLREAAIIQSLLEKIESDFVVVESLDCSPFYHGDASGVLDPLKGWIDSTMVHKAHLIDFELQTDKVKKILKQHSKKHCVFLCLGNTLSNLNSNSTHMLLHSYMKKGDVLVADYTEYADSFFQNTDVKNDGAAKFAKTSLSDILNINQQDIQVKIESDIEKKEKYVKLTFNYNKSNCEFKSMLRRYFDLDHLAKDNQFDVIGESEYMGGPDPIKIKLIEKVKNTEP